MATKRKSLAKWSRTTTDRVGKVTFADGSELVMDLNQLHADVVDDIEWYGVKQKCADAGSDAESLTAFKEAVVGKWNDLIEGRFNANGAGGGIFTEAIARIKGVTVDAVRAAVAKASEEQIASWRKNDKVKLAMAEIAAERARARVASDEGIEVLEIEFD